MNSKPGSKLDVAELNWRIAHLRNATGHLTLGVELPDGILDVGATAARLNLPAPTDMDDLLEHGRTADLQAVVETAERTGTKVQITEADAVFAPLVTRPEKIVCVGFNYRAHVAEAHAEVPKAPPLFAKYRNALNHHLGVVALPTDVDREFDYETELVMVFGRTCRNVPEVDALDVIAGYATGNDVTARGLQTNTSQFLAGKCSDGFAPVGPWLVPQSKVPDPNALRIQTWLNGEARQDANTRDMIFNCRQLVAYVTSLMTMQPGDLLFTGTPPGVIWGQAIPLEDRRWLRAGDQVVSSLEGLGELHVNFR